MIFSSFTFLLFFMPLVLLGILPMIVGILAAAVQLCLTKAYGFAPAKEISVYDYSQIIFAAFLGFLFWGELPDLLSVIGYVVIIGCAIFRAFF